MYRQTGGQKSAEEFFNDEPIIYPHLQTANLMKGVTANTVSGMFADDKFIGSMADFSVELFKKSIADNENSLISPLSVMLALSMTANGADNETLSQMEAVLGGSIQMNDLNKYLYSYVKGLPSSEKSKLGIANSIWFRDISTLNVKPGFLQTNADYYGAEAYKSAFNETTVTDINDWVSANTDGMIDSILDEISSDAVMFLINAVVFDAEWETVYDKSQVSDGIFTDINGNQQIVPFMIQRGGQKFLDDREKSGVQERVGAALQAVQF